MARDVAGFRAFEALAIDAAAVLVEREKLVAIGGRPVVAAIDHRADVRVTAAVGIGLAAARVGPFFAGVEVPVVGVHVDQLVGVGAGGTGRAADETRAGERVPEVAVDGVDEERFAVGVPVVAPGIGRAVGDGLESFALRMKAPEAAAQGNALLGGCAGHANLAGTRAAAASIEPAVRPPFQAVGEVVIHRVHGIETVENDLFRTVWRVVAVGIGDEDKVWRAHRPHAAVADGDAGEHLDVVGENLA